MFTEQPCSKPLCAINTASPTSGLKHGVHAADPQPPTSSSQERRPSKEPSPHHSLSAPQEAVCDLIQGQGVFHRVKSVDVTRCDWKEMANRSHMVDATSSYADMQRYNYADIK
ncbi:hypothetical protein CB1_000602004 [Camelus ferus]|nr:hypothetical protein CB1_000602004 [Camelus ferus]